MAFVTVIGGGGAGGSGISGSGGGGGAGVSTGYIYGSAGTGYYNNDGPLTLEEIIEMAKKELFEINGKLPEYNALKKLKQ